MKKIAIAAFAVLTAGCSGMGGMHSGSSGSTASGFSGSYDPNVNWNSTTTPVTDPRTGQLTFYHGG